MRLRAMLAILLLLLSVVLTAQPPPRSRVTAVIDLDAETYANLESYRHDERVVFVDSQPLGDATNTSPVVIRIESPHGHQTGDQVRVAGVGGNTNANGLWTVTRVDAVRFSLYGSVGNGEYVAGSGTAAGGGSIEGRLRRVPKEASIEEMLEAILRELIHNEVLETRPTTAVRQKQQAVRAAQEALEEEKRRATERREVRP